MKDIIWLGNTHDTVKGYSNSIKQDIGYDLDNIQRGLEPHDWKPMHSVGRGVKEIRIHEENEYRILYVAKFEKSIYVLHVFVKKTEQTLKRDIELAKQRYTQMLEMRSVKK